MGGYTFPVIIGFLMFVIGIIIAASKTLEFTSGSKREGLVEEGIYTRRLGGCIGLEGVLITTLSGICSENDNPTPLFIIIPISIVVCGIIVYFIQKYNPKNN